MSSMRGVRLNLTTTIPHVRVFVRTDEATTDHNHDHRPDEAFSGVILLTMEQAARLRDDLDRAITDLKQLDES